MLCPFAYPILFLFPILPSLLPWFLFNLFSYAFLKAISVFPPFKYDDGIRAVKKRNTCVHICLGILDVHQATNAMVASLHTSNIKKREH